MNHNHLDAIRTVQALGLRLADATARAVEVSVHPSFTSLRSVQTVIEADGLPIAIGAQSCHDEDAGAFTGEVSPTMLAKLHVTYVIAGHSERRQLFGESDDVVASKLRAILRNGMTPILCVGETLAEREEGATKDRLATQVISALGAIEGDDVGRLVIAYEPIWAIGTGRTAEPTDAEDAAGFIRSLVGETAGDPAAATVRIQYGGSVTPDNAPSLVACANVDGALVGGASLDAGTFSQVVDAVARVAGHTGP